VLSARNYLDNSDFRNPVNLKGQTEYKGEVDTIDKWSFFRVSRKLTLEEEGVRISDNEDSTSTEVAMLRQYVDVTHLRGKTVTFAAKTKGADIRLNINNNKTTYYVTDNDNWVVRTESYTIPEDAASIFVGL
jgi:hypothetical protein